MSLSRLRNASAIARGTQASGLRRLRRDSFRSCLPFLVPSATAGGPFGFRRWPGPRRLSASAWSACNPAPMFAPTSNVPRVSIEYIDFENASWESSFPFASTGFTFLNWITFGGFSSTGFVVCGGAALNRAWDDAFTRRTRTTGDNRFSFGRPPDKLLQVARTVTTGLWKFQCESAQSGL